MRNKKQTFWCISAAFDEKKARVYNVSTMKKEKFVTDKYLEKILAEQSQMIISAVDEIMLKNLKFNEGKFGTIEKNLTKMEERLSKKKMKIKRRI